MVGNLSNVYQIYILKKNVQWMCLCVPLLLYLFFEGVVEEIDKLGVPFLWLHFM